jgi:hypothetical protein
VTPVLYGPGGLVLALDEATALVNVHYDPLSVDAVDGVWLFQADVADTLVEVRALRVADQLTYWLTCGPARWPLPEAVAAELLTWARLAVEEA